MYLSGVSPKKNPIVQILTRLNMFIFPVSRRISDVEVLIPVDGFPSDRR